MTNPLMNALQKFEVVEANLVKVERLWDETRSLIPTGVCFGDSPEYEDRCRSFDLMLQSLPKISGWKPEIQLPELNVVVQNRLDALELDQPEVQIYVENSIDTPGRDIREYRFRFDRKRRELVRDTLVELIDTVDADIRTIRSAIGKFSPHEKITDQYWDHIRMHVDQMDVLLGSSVSRPEH